ncbi:MAG: DMT family transporter, partial [Sulfurospirillum sp.]|nr:DMT family transporter [Sulfurospirillum sp.]
MLFSVRYLSQKFSALFLTAIQAFVGTIFFFPLAIWEYFTLPMHLSFEVFGWLCYLGIVVTLGGYGMFNLALSRIEASKASVFVNLIPVFTVLLAYLFLNERLSQTEMLACFVIFGGIIISQLPNLTKKEKSI